MCFPSEGSKGSECNDISKVKQACSSELPTPPFDCGDQQDLPVTKIIFQHLVQVFSQVEINYSRFLPTFITQNNCCLRKCENHKWNKKKERKGAKYSIIDCQWLTSFKPGWFY